MFSLFYRETNISRVFMKKIKELDEKEWHYNLRYDEREETYFFTLREKKSNFTFNIVSVNYINLYNKIAKLIDDIKKVDAETEVLAESLYASMNSNV